MTPRDPRLDVSTMNIQQLAGAARTGDNDAAHALYMQLHPVACKLASSYKSLAHEWQSLYGECLFSCISSPKYSATTGPFRPYFSKAFVNELNTASNSRHHEVVLMPMNADRDNARVSFWAPGDDDAVNRDLRHALKTVIGDFRAGKLRRRQREQWANVAELVFIEQHSVADAANTLNVDVETVEQIISRRIYPAIRLVYGVGPGQS